MRTHLVYHSCYWSFHLSSYSSTVRLFVPGNDDKTSSVKFFGLRSLRFPHGSNGEPIYKALDNEPKAGTVSQFPTSWPNREENNAEIENGILTFYKTHF